MQVPELMPLMQLPQPEHLTVQGQCLCKGCGKHICLNMLHTFLAATAADIMRGMPDVPPLERHTQLVLTAVQQLAAQVGLDFLRLQLLGRECLCANISGSDFKSFIFPVNFSRSCIKPEGP